MIIPCTMDTKYLLMKSLLLPSKSKSSIFNFHRSFLSCQTDLLAVFSSRKLYGYSIPFFANAGFNNSGEITQLRLSKMFNTFTANTSPVNSRGICMICRHFRFEYWAFGHHCHTMLTNLLRNKP